MHLYSPLTEYRDRGVDTKEMIPAYRGRYAEILEFTHFVRFFSFDKIGENHKEKSLVNKVTVVVALDFCCSGLSGTGRQSARSNVFPGAEGNRGAHEHHLPVL